jgi:hypothetical protein
MFTTFRNTALAAAAVGLALISPAQANWLVDFNQPASNRGGGIQQVHLQFVTLTFLTSDTTSAFSLATTSDPTPISQFSYALTAGETCSAFGFTAADPCEVTSFGSVLSETLALFETSNPDVYDTLFAGTLTLTDLAAVPEPASLLLLGWASPVLG